MNKIGDYVGHCPICKSEHVTYLDEGFFNTAQNQVHFDVQCEDCRIKFLEIYSVEFLKTIAVVV